MIGQSAPRRDGPLKVTGGARYSYERPEVGKAAIGFMLGATIAKGAITAIDPRPAERAPGVLFVMTHLNCPKQAPSDTSLPDTFGRPWPVLIGPQVEFFGQPVALVVAETLEQARAASKLIEVTYNDEQGAFDLKANAKSAYAPKIANTGAATDSCIGDLDKAMTDAPVTVDHEYTTPHQFGTAMELGACLASWTGDELTVWSSVQGIEDARNALARTLRMPPEKVHVDAAYVGGGFGAKLRLHEETIFAALAARQIGRPVKVAQTRRQVFTICGHRPEMIHRVRLAATRDGQLTGVGHDANMQNAVRDPWVEQVATVMRGLYAAPNRLTRHRSTDLDLNIGEAVRAPGEAPGLLAIETAMDELAVALDMDPVELRIRNEPARDPERDVPQSARKLVECMREGAVRFGWADRPGVPASRREGDLLIGYGMAGAIRPQFQGATKVTVRMDANGRVLVRSDLTDIGTGSYTIVAQVAADQLGIALDQVDIELARSDLPKGSGSGGSWGASNTAAAIHIACDALRTRVLGPGGDRASLAQEVARRFPDGVETEGTLAAMADAPNYEAYSINSYGASFAEVSVDVASGEVRLRRMLGVFAAGRIINPQTARSQLMGGMIWGVGSALHEAAHVDQRFGNWVNGDFAEYVIPVNADIQGIEVIMLDDVDDKANALGIKGVGELGNCGTGAAVANAVFNATGIRIRDFPITLDKLLPELARRYARI